MIIQIFASYKLPHINYMSRMNIGTGHSYRIVQHSVDVFYDCLFNAFVCIRFGALLNHATIAREAQLSNFS